MNSEITNDERTYSLDGKTFSASSLSQYAKDHFQSLDFVEEQILQKSNELQIADTARIMYTSVLKSELNPNEKS